MSPSFKLGGAHIGNVPGNISQNLYNTIHNNALFFLSTFSKWGISRSGRSFSPYDISYRNNMGLTDVFNYLLYTM